MKKNRFTTTQLAIAGLMIAIPVIVVYNYLNRRLEKMENEIDDIVTNIINIFRR